MWIGPPPRRWRRWEEDFCERKDEGGGRAGGAGRAVARPKRTLAPSKKSFFGSFSRSPGRRQGLRRRRRQGDAGGALVRRSPEAISSCRREALAAFGDATVYVEKYLESPRHIEVQVFGDGSETSSRSASASALSSGGTRRSSRSARPRGDARPARAPRARGRRRRAGRSATSARARSSSCSRLRATFFFLEMNTRLQVEHPVTEEAFGVDLVLLQLARRRRASRLPELPARASRHAIEARVYAEDPEAGFLPQTGRVLLYREPGGPGVRVESGLVEGQEVDDPLRPPAREDRGLGRDARGGARAPRSPRSPRRRFSASRRTSPGCAAFSRRRRSPPGGFTPGSSRRSRCPPPPPPSDAAFEAAAAVLSAAAAPRGSGRPALPDPFDGRFRAGGGA